METLIIKVTSLRKAKTMAEALAEQSDVMAVSIQHLTTPRRTRSRVDPVTLASETSLAQAWNSPEDEVWDAYYQELCTKKAL